MVRPTVLASPWVDLAAKLGGAGLLYDLLQAELGCSQPTAKRICYGTGQLTYSQWCQLTRLFKKYRIPFGR